MSDTEETQDSLWDTPEEPEKETLWDTPEEPEKETLWDTPEEPEKETIAETRDESHQETADQEAKENEAKQAMEEAARRKEEKLTEDLEEYREMRKEEKLREAQAIEDLKRKRIERQKERQEEEKRMAEERQQEDARRKAEDEERKRRKMEEEAKRKAERERKRREAEKRKGPKTPNFKIVKKASDGSEEQEEEEEKKAPQKSKEQLEAEKRAILAQRIQPLEELGDFNVERLVEKAKELHDKLWNLISNKYDLEEKFKRQQYDMVELAERARQMSKMKKRGVASSAQIDESYDRLNDKHSNAPPPIQLASKFEKNLDRRTWGEKLTCYSTKRRLLPDLFEVLRYQTGSGLPGNRCER